MAEERMESPASAGALGQASPGGPAAAAERAAFERAEQTVLEFVNENRGPYGGPMARRELSFSVLETNRMQSDIRVRIAYRPANRFSGRAGEEWVLVGQDGAVRARELVRRPRETPPWVLIALATASVIAAAIMVPVIILRADPTGDPLYRAGRTLWMRATPPTLVDEIQYAGRTLNGDEVNFRIAGSGDGRKLAVTQVSLFNQTSQQVSVNIDEAAAVMTGVDGVEYTPVNVVERSVGLAGPPDRKFLYPDFIGLWRPITITAAESVVGMLVFEVPPDFVADRLTWRASDTIQIGFRE